MSVTVNEALTGGFPPYGGLEGAEPYTRVAFTLDVLGKILPVEPPVEEEE
jgi:hypothetical protein